MRNICSNCKSDRIKILGKSIHFDNMKQVECKNCGLTWARHTMK